MKIIGEELERVTHFKCLRTSAEEECCMSQREWDQVGEIGRNAGEYCAQKDAYESDHRITKYLCSLFTSACSRLNQQ